MRSMMKRKISAEKVPETDEEALQWLADKPAVAIDLYKLYRNPEATYKMDVQSALYETLKACVGEGEHQRS